MYAGLGLGLSLDIGASKAGGSGAPVSAAAALLGAETDGVAFSATDDSMEVRDTVTPANNYVGTPGAKLTVTRASTARYYDANGLLASAAINTLRRDKDNRLDGDYWYLVEDARTNLFLHSEDYSNAAWTKTNATVTANATTAPDGTTTADLIIPNTTSGLHDVAQGVAQTGVPGSYSIHLKPNGYTKFGVRESTYIGYYLCVDLTGSGTVLDSFQCTAQIQALPNGWYRVTMNATGGGAGQNMRQMILPNTYTTGQPDTINWSGNGTSGMYYWGSMHEIHPLGGTPKSSSYIPTTTATVTRAADTVYLLTTAFRYNTAAVTIYSKAASAMLAPGVSIIAVGNNADYYMTVIVYNDANHSPRVGSNTPAEWITASAIAPYAINKSAVAASLNNANSALNGTLGVLDTAVSMPELTQTRLWVGTSHPTASANFMGWIKEGMQLPRRMSDAEIDTLTT